MAIGSVDDQIGAEECLDLPDFLAGIGFLKDDRGVRVECERLAIGRESDPGDAVGWGLTAAKLLTGTNVEQRDGADNLLIVEFEFG